MLYRFWLDLWSLCGRGSLRFSCPLPSQAVMTRFHYSLTKNRGQPSWELHTEHWCWLWQWGEMRHCDHDNGEEPHTPDRGASECTSEIKDYYQHAVKSRFTCWMIGTPRVSAVNHNVCLWWLIMGETSHTKGGRCLQNWHMLTSVVEHYDGRHCC